MSEGNSTVSYRDIIDFPGYRAGDDGSIWSCRSFGGVTISSWHLLKPTIDRYGYRFLTMRRNGKSFQRTVHRLILEAFVGPRPKGMQARHFPDQDPTNNAIRNLRWDTPKANQGDRVANGTHSRGENNAAAKFDEATVSAIRAEYAQGKTSQRKLAKKHGVAQYAIFAIVARKKWTHLP